VHTPLLLFRLSVLLPGNLNYPTNLSFTAMSHPIIYLIRHGEKGPKLSDGKDPQGLDAQGLQRAQGLRRVFGPDSPYNIGYILAEKPGQDGDRARPSETVAPLAEDLGIEVNETISRDDAKAVAKAAEHYDGSGNVLICWEHGQLTDITKELGIKSYAPESGWSGKVKYPSDRFDLIWTVNPPYKKIDNVTSEGVEGLDSDETGQAVTESE